MMGVPHSPACFVLVLLLCYGGPPPAEGAGMTTEQQLFTDSLDGLDSLEIHAATAQTVEMDGREVLELEGMVLIPDLKFEDLSVEVEVFAPAPCYPGIVFRFADLFDYELAYAVPVASGQSDAIQYDPVFNGSNTWQLHTGAAYQKQARVPTGEWFTLRVDVVGERAAVRVGDQPPLVVERLSHRQTAGRIGLWTFRPARFRNLRVTPPRSFEDLSGEDPRAPEGAIDGWWLSGVGDITNEPNGVLNLNRYMRSSDTTEVRLIRCFGVDEEIDLEVAFGYSDELRLSIDGALLFEGTHIFTGFESQKGRGWVWLEDNRLVHRTGPGRHQLEAVLRVTEPFGWGLIVTLGGGTIRVLPSEEIPSDPTPKKSR
jgi:hypothetical protein